MEDGFDLAELDHFCESLSPAKRDELLQCRLIAASIDGDTLIERLEECLLAMAGQEMIEGLPERWKPCLIQAVGRGRTATWYAGPR
jgi:hypothetical protein